LLKRLPERVLLLGIAVGVAVQPTITGAMNMKRILLAAMIALAAVSPSSVIRAQEVDEDSSCALKKIVQYNADGTVNCTCSCLSPTAPCC
jgi:hypothetical protein